MLALLLTQPTLFQPYPVASSLRPDLYAAICHGQALAQQGAASIVRELSGQHSTRSGKNLRILTHCNTGSLATAAYGTALGVVRALHEQGRLGHVYCTETRPFNQGRFRWLQGRRLRGL